MAQVDDAPAPAHTGTGSREGAIDELVSRFQLSQPNNKKRRLLMGLTDSAFKSYELGLIVSKCCKDMDLSSAYEAYQRFKEQEVYPNHTTFTNLLSLTAGLGDQGSGQEFKRLVEPPSNIHAALQIYSDMVGRNHIIPESAFSALIRSCCMNDLTGQAMEFYRKLQQLIDVQPKLRTFSRLLDALSQSPRPADHCECVHVFDELVTRYKLVPTEKEYVYMLRLCVRTRDRDRFHAVLSALMDSDVVVPESALLRFLLYQWFEKGEGENGFRCAESAVSDSGVVAVNGERLRSLDLQQQYRLQLLEQLDHFATLRADRSSYNANNKVKGQKKKMDCRTTMEQRTESGPSDMAAAPHSSAEEATSGARDSQRERTWEQFKAWLGTRFDSQSHCSEGGDKGFDIIVDGANVGYCKQNYQGAPAHVDYHQIDQLLVHLESTGHRPLLILHCRHIARSMVPDEECERLVARWQQQEMLYPAPRGFNDDWFWLYASVRYRCKVVTNDEMRDHHFKLFHPRWFSRWSERNRVQFTFGMWREQQLRQQRNASRKSGRLLALLNAPINITSDADYAAPHTLVSIGDSSSDCSDSSDYGSCCGDDQNNNSTNNNNTCSSSFTFRRREVHLRWPSEYTYCMQHVVSDCCEGFYCPPIPAVTASTATDDADGGRGDAIGTREEKAAIQQWLLDSGFDLSRWLCFYKQAVVPVALPPRPDCDSGSMMMMQQLQQNQMMMQQQQEDETRKRKYSPIEET